MTDQKDVPKTIAVSRSFPLPETKLYRMLMDPEFKRDFHSRLKVGNPWMVLFYRLGILPLIGMGKQMMLLSTIGRKTGKQRFTPIGYYRVDGQVYVFSGWGKGASWFQNMQSHPDRVQVQIGFKHSQARAEVINDPMEARQILEHFVMQDPEGAKLLMGWNNAQDFAKEADFSLMIEKVLIVRFRLEKG
jgi:deazaflavin-dependent oxidoreductase (nitroreductase family)